MKLISLLSPYAPALILTLIIEGVLCLLFTKSKPWLKFTCLVNLFTNPLVNFVYTVIYLTLEKHSFTKIIPVILVIPEIIVWLSEAYLFYQFSRLHDGTDTSKKNYKHPLPSKFNALLFSFVLNAASCGIGLLLQI